MKWVIYILLFTGLGFMSFLHQPEKAELWDYPSSWSSPNFLPNERVKNEQAFELGKRLFYDVDLSLDSTISCASCHFQATAFTHVDHAVSHGIGDSIGTRNSPVLINLMWQKQFHWDGGVLNLEMQTINPVTHPKEMGSTLELVLNRLTKSDYYRKKFKDVFKKDKIGSKEFLQAMNAYTSALISCNSKYDQVQRGEAMFTDQEMKGYKIFQSECASCHKEPLFSSGELKANGLALDRKFNDFGRMLITDNSTDSLLFKVPTLRNIQYSYPYMHDGRYKTLNGVVKHYVNDLRDSSLVVSKDLNRNMTLSGNDQKDLIAFLYTLTDKSFLFNPKFAFPKDLLEK